MKDLSGPIGDRLDELIERERVPGASVGVIRGPDEYLLNRGVTSVDNPLAVGEQTLYQIASNTKPLTAALLVALGVDLGTPVRKLVPAFRLSDGRRTKSVKVRHLLSHQVGWDGDELLARPPTGSVLEQLAGARQLVPPGTEFTYGNAGYTVAGLIAEAVSGVSYGEALGEHLLEPLGMSRTFLTADEAITHRVACPHWSPEGYEPVILRGGGWQPGWELLAYEAAVGGLISCVVDMLQWLRFQLGELYVAPLPPQVVEEMQQQQVALNPIEGWSLGWATRGQHTLWHGGSTSGYRSRTMLVPSHRLGIVVLTNTTTGSLLCRDLCHTIVELVTGRAVADPEAMTAQPDHAPYCGRYWGAFGSTTVSSSDGMVEVANKPHPTDEGMWQPLPEQPLHCVFYDEDHAVADNGELVDFAPDRSWVRYHGRVRVRL